MNPHVRSYLFVLASISTVCTVQVILHSLFGIGGVLCGAFAMIGALLWFDPLIRTWFNK